MPFGGQEPTVDLLEGGNEDVMHCGRQKTAVEWTSMVVDGRMLYILVNK
jgi:hypothetical protein